MINTPCSQLAELREDKIFTIKMYVKSNQNLQSGSQIFPISHQLAAEGRTSFQSCVDYHTV